MTIVAEADSGMFVNWATIGVRTENVYVTLTVTCFPLPLPVEQPSFGVAQDMVIWPDGITPKPAAFLLTAWPTRVRKSVLVGGHAEPGAGAKSGIGIVQDAPE
jgi:hypothetical protein